MRTRYHPNAPSLAARNPHTTQSAGGADESKDKEDGDGAIVPVRIGDLIFLEDSSDGVADGIVVGDGAMNRCGVLKAPAGYEEQWASEPLKFEDAIFRVVPMLSYRDRKLLRMNQKRVKPGSRSGSRASRSSRASLGDFESAEVELEGLKNRATSEEEHNRDVLELVKSGAIRDVVKYGVVIQLEHVKTGLFLASHKSAAPTDPSCRRVSLKHGSHSAQFHVMPRFRAQSEGSTLYYTNSFTLESAKLERLYLHVSPDAKYVEIKESQNQPSSNTFYDKAK